MRASALDRLARDLPSGAPGRRWLLDRGWPHAGDELWRYAPLTAIAEAAGADVPDPVPGAIAALIAGLPPGPRVIVVDGRYRPDLSDLPAGSGLTIDLDAAPGPFRPGATADAFAAANHAAGTGTTLLRVAVTDSPVTVHLVHLAVDAPTSSPRTEVSVGPEAYLELIETFRASPGARLVNALTAIEVAIGGRVDHLRVLEGARGAAHVGRTEIVARDRAIVRAAALVAGPGPARHTVTANIAGADAEVTLAGLSVPASGAHHDTSVSVLHRASGATSRQQYVSIVPDGGRASFTGHVTVAAGTTGTDADQQNRNLLLGPTARADTRPWLQIDADDVACTHGATVGRLDDDGLFYLRSRGIPERAARAMLVQAFARTALEGTLPPGPGREWLTTSSTRAIDAILHGTTAPAARQETR